MASVVAKNPLLQYDGWNIGVLKLSIFSISLVGHLQQLKCINYKMSCSNLAGFKYTSLIYKIFLLST